MDNLTDIEGLPQSWDNAEQVKDRAAWEDQIVLLLGAVGLLTVMAILALMLAGSISPAMVFVLVPIAIPMLAALAFGPMRLLRR